MGLINKDKDEIYLIVGLGNPGVKYELTRHNIGFQVVDFIANKIDEKFKRVQFNALIAKGSYKGKKIILVKPQTFMNNSGQSVGSLARYYKVDFENVIVIFDDVDLPFETIRIRSEGGSGGHKGMKSIIQHLGNSLEFPRIRFGVGRPPGRMDTADYVLQRFSKEEEKFIDLYIQKASDAIFDIVENDIVHAMNHFNGS
jgi:PTH1 family peptidyl-tRNA hydrolase